MLPDRCKFCLATDRHSVVCGEIQAVVAEALREMAAGQTSFHRSTENLLIRLGNATKCSTCGAVGKHPYDERCQRCVMAEEGIRRMGEGKAA